MHSYKLLLLESGLNKLVRISDILIKHMCKVVKLISTHSDDHTHSDT